MEPTDCSTKVLYRYVLRCKDQVDPVFVIHWERSRFHGSGYHLLDGKTSQVDPMRVGLIGVFTSDEDRTRDIGAGLICVKRDSAPPFGDRRLSSSSGRRNGIDEVLNEELLGSSPTTIPDKVNVDGGGRENRTHVVTELNQVGRTLKFLGRGEGSRGKLWVDVLWVSVQGLQLRWI